MDKLRSVYDKIKNTEAVSVILNDPEYKGMAASLIGLAINLAYAVYNGFLGFAGHSWWFITMFAYHLTLIINKLAVIHIGIRSKHGRGSGRLASGITGGILLVLSVVLGGTIILTSNGHTEAAKDLITMITLAAYAFFKLTKAVITSVKAGKSRSPIMISLKAIGLSAALGSMLSLTRSMNVTFAAENSVFTRNMNMYVGIGACLIIIALGVSLICFTMISRLHHSRTGGSSDSDNTK